MTDHPAKEPARDLLYGECPRCGYLSFPLLRQSPCGHVVEPERKPLDAEGTVYSWTRDRLKSEEGQILVMADFLDGRLRVTAPVLDAANVEIGDKVRLVEGTDTPYAMHLVDVG